jgi:ribosomal protein L3 glutamine methyltransferase
MQKEFNEALLELRTLRDLLRFGVTHFTKAQLYFGHGTDNAWDEMIALAFYVLNLPHSLFPEVLDTRLTLAERKSILAMMSQRIKTRKPLPYLTHEAYFAGLSFYVDERVLIPRSPIAELIEKHFSPWMEEDRVQNILDMGTGSGCIAIACAFAFTLAYVDAVDISPEALAVARHNVTQYHLTDRVFLYESDLFTHLKGKSYDIIIANPPYVSMEEMGTLPPEYAHEPKEALAAGKDGLLYARRLLKEAVLHLENHGILILEVGQSAKALEEAYPEVPFLWLEFTRGGDGVLLLTRSQLMEYLPMLAD